MRLVRAVVVATVAFLSLSMPAFADQTYHSENLPLSLTSQGSAAGEPQLQSGHVVNIHTQGPVNFAIEGYMLNGAKANTTYRVVLSLKAGGCGGPFLFLFPNGATVVTDAQGNGHDQLKITPVQVAALGLHGAHLGITWLMVDGPIAAYGTPCSDVHID
jgi:hypothetical protein